MRNSIILLPTMKYLEILEKYFGYSSFRGIQQQIVESIGAGKDTLGLMPTGGGKSITFQVPALAMDGVCIVVTPLIALMKDQVMHLRDRGILASAIYSGMSYNEILQVLDNAVYGGVKFLYVSPERLSTSLFMSKIKYMNICFVAVDEAHCISQWGYDFRPSYLRIADVREVLPGIPILALTATATPRVVEDIMERLNFDEKRVFKMSFHRENLVYVVRTTDDKASELVHILSSVPGCAIVYTRSRQGTKDVSKFLNERGISATFYHAGLDFAVKDQRQMDWQNNEVRVMVATNAFGMGIDKPDVRVVIHMDCPDSLEAYFQEAGRGGRDGRRSYAVLLYSKSDRTKLLRRIPECFPDKEYVCRVYDELAYFFQLGIDEGEGANFEFDIDRFCQTFRHFPTRLNGAMAALQRAGYIEYDAEPNTHPRCMFLLSRDELYNVMGLSYSEECVMTSLLRLYGGLFSDFVYIEEGNIAKHASLTPEQVRVALKNLSHRHIIKYIPRRNVPLVFYSRQRILSNRLVFHKEVYEVLQDRLVERIESVLRYAESIDVCRSSLLLNYFGEESSVDCERCDVCQERRQKRSFSDDNTCVQLLLDAFNDAGGAMPISALSKLPIPRRELDEAIRLLRQQGRLEIQNQYLHLIS